MELKDLAELAVAAKAAGVDRFLGCVFNSSLVELDQLLAEQVRAWRLSNIISILRRAKDQCTKAGVKYQEVPFSIIHPLLSAASDEEDGSLQELWAGLISNTVGGLGYASRSCLPILSRLSPDEAKVLVVAFDSVNEIVTRLNREFIPSAVEQISLGPPLSVMHNLWFRAGLTQIDAGEFATSSACAVIAQRDAALLMLENFQQLGLLRVVEFSASFTKAEHLYGSAVNELHLTRLGYHFLAAVSGPKGR